MFPLSAGTSKSQMPLPKGERAAHFYRGSPRALLEVGSTTLPSGSSTIAEYGPEVFTAHTNPIHAVRSWIADVFTRRQRH